MSFIQLEGNIKAGSTAANTSYAAEITSLLINRAVETITAPATFANATTDPNAGPETDSLTINFLGDPLTSSSFNNALWAAMDTDDKIMYFAATLNSSTTISATNPLFTCQIVVVDLDTGGDVAALRQQSKTYPIKAGTLVRATTGTI